MTTERQKPAETAEHTRAGGRLTSLTSTDHKRIGLLIIGTALVLMSLVGVLALLMRSQLAQPGETFIDAHLYNQLFTMHGSGMIYMVMTPIALGLGVYLVPLQLGAPGIAMPRITLMGYWLYVCGAAVMMSGFATTEGAHPDGWFSYPPLADSQHSPSVGSDLWIVGVFLSAVGMILIGWTVLWTVLRKRAPGMTMLRMPVFSWSMVATCLMVVGSFPALLAALVMLAVGRVDPAVFTSNVWNIGYQHIFWFYGHPVVYVMFFPYMAAVGEVLAVFSQRRYFAYKGTVMALLTFAALSMSVWGHHMFATGQAANNYYSLTSIALLMPAGIEYFALVGTILGGRLVFRTPMLFALAFIPQFLIGGLSGIMVGTPVIDYHVTDSYFVVAHLHYVLFAGSAFGLFAAIYYWFPKATGCLLREGLGKVHFWLLVIGTNLTFLPMFGLGYLGMPRRISSYTAVDGWGWLNLLSSCGAGVLALAMVVFMFNVLESLRSRRPAGDDPWNGQTLEWTTSSPPSEVNFTPEHPLIPINSYAPLLDLKQQRQEAAEKEAAEKKPAAGEGNRP
ncbi:cytochrome c oxidase subunit I [Streptomyces sediminimaris]|uniref:cytochrome c oxidase subunit I n=1 Tax=Streptomyces sediminimaris TaxID=3383721 RepID=UPI003999CE5B